MELIEETMRQALYAIALGGFAFWIPVVFLAAIYKIAVSVLVLNVASVISLAIVSSISWSIQKKMPKWGWVLAGVYILGPSAISAASAFTRIPPSAGRPGDWVWLLIICLLPPMTLWLALLSGTIFSVIFVTLALPLLLLLPWRDQVSREKADQHPLRTG